jgi:tetratricopeptide (TPR) repeat protein
VHVLNRACYIKAVRNLQLEVAQKSCDDALRVSPDDLYTLDSRCLLRFRTGDFANAIADCDAALRQNANLPTSLYVPGLAKMRLGYSDLGKADIAAALHESRQCFFLGVPPKSKVKPAPK